MDTAEPSTRIRGTVLAAAAVAVLAFAGLVASLLVLKSETRRAEQESSTLRREIGTLKERQGEGLKERQLLTGQIEDLQRQLREARAEAEAARRTEARTAGRWRVLESDLAKTRGELKNAESQAQRILVERDRLRREGDAARVQLTATQQRARDLQQQHGEAQSKLTKLEAEMNRLKAEKDKIKVELEQQKAVSEQKSAQIQQLTQELDKLKAAQP